MKVHSWLVVSSVNIQSLIIICHWSLTKPTLAGRWFQHDVACFQPYMCDGFRLPFTFFGDGQLTTNQLSTILSVDDYMIIVVQNYQWVLEPL